MSGRPSLRRGLLALGRLAPPLRRARLRPVTRRISRTLMRIEVTRIRRGRPSIGGRVAGGAPTLLLTTTGRRTGRAHTVPLLYHQERAGTLLLIAANGAADWDPEWLLNLRSTPTAEVEVGGEVRQVVADELDPVARAAVWDEATDVFAGLAAAQASSRREIPLVRLLPR